MEGKSALGINGTRKTGMDARNENVKAACAVANVVKSSLGPIGLDKMIVDETGDVIVTNDGATILKRLEVEHPAARMLVELAQLQDNQIGDGTTSVVVVAAELLKRANELVAQGIHPTSVISGYNTAVREAIKYLKNNLSAKVESLGKETLQNVARTSMSSKIIHTNADLFSKMCVDAIMSVKTVNDFGDIVYPYKAVGILLLHGRSAAESTLVQGFALHAARAGQLMPTAVSNAKIALVDFDLRAVKMKLGINITVSDPTKVDGFKQREIDITRERIQKMIDAGANVILTTWGIEDTMMKMMVENGVMGVRRVKLDDMRRIAKATGGTIIHNMSDLSGDEVFETKSLGVADRVEEHRCGDGDEYITITGTKNEVCASIICRGANYFVLEEMQRALNDSLCAVARTLEAGSVVAGGGAAECALSVYLENFAHTLGNVEQLAIAQFAEALLVIPKTLAMNGALDATDLVAKLRVEHNDAYGEKAGSEGRFQGLDLEEGCTRNNLAAGVLEPMSSKVRSFEMATEAAVTILRIDDCIRLNHQEERQ